MQRKIRLELADGLLSLSRDNYGDVT